MTDAKPQKPWPLKKIFAGLAAGAILGGAGAGYYYADQNGHLDQFAEKFRAAVTEYMPEKEAVPLKTLAEAMRDADAEKGDQLYSTYCTACHGPATENGYGGLGPNLFNLVGEKQGRYGTRNSKALQETLTGVWDREALDAWLENPQQTVPGTSMYFSGLKNPQDRADLIAYLETRKPSGP